MKQEIASFVSGVLFAIGLGISGMTQPVHVVGFLDFFGKWDPALLGVMGGAVVTYGIFFRLILKRKQPLFAGSFGLPTKKDLDARLLTGSALFGLGWGIAGYCPGPGLVSLASGKTTVLVFVASMLAGMLLFKIMVPTSPAPGKAAA